MKKLLLVCAAVLTSLSLSACSDTPDEEYRVSFYKTKEDMENNIEYFGQYVQKKDQALVPEQPLLDHNEFTKWNYDGKEFDFSTKITEEIKIYAEWDELTIVEDTYLDSGLHYTLYTNGEASVKKEYFYQLPLYSADIKSTITFEGTDYTVTSINKYGFNNWTQGNSITIPNTITNIGEEAFKNCSDLTNVVLPSSVVTLGKGAFSSCTKLTSITLSSNIKQIQSNTFDGCSALTTVNIPTSVNSIFYSAFKDCTSLESIFIPNTVLNIYSEAFKGCSSLTINTAHISQPDNWFFEYKDEDCNVNWGASN